MTPLQDLKLFVQEIEQFSAELSCAYGVEHLSGPQGIALLYLVNHRDEDISIKMIENHLKISKSVTSHLIKRMEKNGFIKLEQAQTDKRIKFVRLTEFGLAQADKMGDYIAALHRSMLAGVSKSDIEAASHVFTQVRKNIVKEKAKGELHV